MLPENDSAMSVDCDSIDSKLTGLSLGERHRSLNQLIKEASPDVIAPDVVRGWAQGSQAHQVYITRLADHFRNAALLCELLCSENEMVVSVATHATWFFQGQDGELCNADYFVTHVFPHASYHSICRIISALSVNLKDETVAEDFYSKISDMYGQSMAIRLLPVCSNNFIRSQIMGVNFEVPSMQLIYIYKKDQELVLDYLQKYLKKEGYEKLPMSYFSRQGYNDLWSLVAQNHPDLYLDLLEKYPTSVNTKLGARITKSFLKLALDKVINEPYKFIQILHVPTLISKIKGENLETFIMNLLPAKETHLSYHQISSVLNHIKPAFRTTLIMKVYPLKYNGASILDRDDFPDWDLAENLPPDIRNSWAVKRIENSKPTDQYREDFFLKYASIDEAISRLKSLSYSTPDLEKRTTLLQRMIECCKINDDKERLLEILLYIADRHKNDQYVLRCGVLKRIRDSFELHLLSAEHWEVINEMIGLMCVAKEIEKYYLQDFLRSILEEYVHYCLINNLEIETTVEKLIHYETSDINLLVGVPEYEFKVLEVFFEKYKDILEKNPDSEKVRNIISSLLYSYSKRSDRNNHSLTECTWLMDYIKGIMGNPEKYYMMNTFSTYLSSDIKARKMFADEVFKHSYKEAITCHFLKHDASVLIRNIDTFIDRTVKDYTIQYYLGVFQPIRTYLMKPFGESLIESLKDIIQVEGEDDRQTALRVVALSLLLDHEECETLVRKYIPLKPKINFTRHAKEYTYGDIFGNYLRHMKPPVSYDTLSCFAKGDYLKFTIYSLLSISFKKSLKDTENFIYQLSKSPVSTKKHAVRLAYFIFPRKDTLELFRKMWDVEKNSSVRDVIFKRTFRLMENERDASKFEEIWLLLKHFMQSFSEVDVNLFSYLAESDKIIPNFISDYCETCWKTLKMLSAQNIDVSDEISCLARSFTDCMEYLNDDFCESIATEYLYSIEDDSSNSENLLSFLVDYIVKAKQVELQNKHIENTCKIFKKFIAENWNKRVDNNFKYRSILKDFVLKCCRQSLNSKIEVNPINLLKSILDMISSALPFGAVVDQHVVLNLTISYKELLQEPSFLDMPQYNVDISPLSSQLIKGYGRKVASYLNSLCEEYGTEVLPIFVNGYNSFISYLFNTNDKKEALELFFIAGLIEGKVTKQCLIMAIELIPVSYPEGNKNMEFYIDLLTRISSEGDITVKMILNNKIDFTDDLFKIGNP